MAKCEHCNDTKMIEIHAVQMAGPLRVIRCPHCLLAPKCACCGERASVCAHWPESVAFNCCEECVRVIVSHVVAAGFRGVMVNNPMPFTFGRLE